MVKKKERKLPFVVQPRLKPILELVGSEESGQVEIERRGFLSVAEKSWVQAVEADDDTQGRLHRLAIKIGAELGLEPKEALVLISDSELADPRLMEYHNELMETLQAMTQFGERRKIAGATCLLVNRVDPSWEVEDTFKLHIDIVDGLYGLYLEEEARSLDALEAAMKKEADDEPQEGTSGKA